MSKIEKTIVSTIQKAAKDVYPLCPKEILSNIYLEIPKERKFGYFSTNIAMRLARLMKDLPMNIADKICAAIRSISTGSAFSDAVEDIRIEKPGFINFYLSNAAVVDSLREIIVEEDRFGSLSLGRRKKVHIEFVSANPTGPLTVAHGRQAAVGDSIARILEFCGYKVTREYYINDEGVQMDILGKSVKARFMEQIGQDADFPENGYKGHYIYELAKEIKEKKGKKALSREFFIDYAHKSIMAMIKKDLDEFGVDFDVWYSQRKLSMSGKIENALSVLRKKGFLYEKDGATWFSSTKFGDDKDRVVIKSDASFTYLAPDIAYHKEKFEKGYNLVINIWGPDHHGYLSRIKAACQALGYKKDCLSVLISQLVTLYRDKKPVRMSTREGEFVSLREVMDEVGKDAARFFFLMRRTDSHLDFDLDLAKAKTMGNPVYYIQYAHARIVNVIKFSHNIKPDLKDLHRLRELEELDITRTLMQYPKVIHSSCRNLEPYILLSYLQNLASLFHSYYDAHRIVTEDASLTKARVGLVMAIKTVLFSGLTLLGVNAPEKM